MPSSASDFSIVPIDAIDAVLEKAPAIRPLIETALNGYTFDALLAKLKDGTLQLWIAYRGLTVDMAMVTRMDALPKHRVGTIVYCTGEHRELWLHHLPALLDWFKANGCARVKLEARRGWQRVLKDWRWTHIMLEKDLA